MLPPWLRSLAKSWTRTPARPIRRPALRPLAEALEDRLAPANLHWLGTAGTGWNTAANWQENATPQAGDTLFFDTTAGTVVNYTSNNDLPAAVTLSGLVVNDASTTGDFTITGAAVTLTGNITHASNGTTNLNLATVTAGVDVTLTNTGGTLTVGAALALGGWQLTIAGAGNTNLTGVVSGNGTGVLQAGKLVEGRILGNAFDETTPNPGGLLTDGPVMGQIQTVSNGQPQSAHVWSDNTTWVYTGQFFDADGQFAFAENIDDNVLVKIDGVTRLRNTNWSEPTTTGGQASGGNATANPNGGTTNFGMGPAGDGWHNIEIRMGNGGGGAGPSGQAGWPGTFGFGLRDSIINLNSVTATDYVVPAASLFRVLNHNAIVMAGTGILTISNPANSYTGPTLVNSGALVVTANGALGSAAGGTTVASGASLALVGGVNYSTAEPLTLSGTGIGGNGAVTSPSGANTFAGPITLAGGTTVAAPAGTSLTLSGAVNLGPFPLSVAGAGNTTLSGAISDTPPAAGMVGGLLGQYFGNINSVNTLLIRTDPNYLGNKSPTVTGIAAQFNFPDVAANSFSPYANVGGVNNAALWTGKINIPTAGTYSFQTGSDDGSVIYIDTTQVVDNNFDQGVTYRQGSIPLTAGVHDITIGFRQGGGGAGLFTNWDPTGGSNFVQLTAASANLMTPGPAVTVATTGTGTVTLSGNSTYAGSTRVQSGTLVVGGNNALGTTAGGTTVAAGATLAFAGGVTYTAAEPVTVTGTGVGGNGAVLNQAGANSFAGPVTLAGDATFGSTAGTLTLAGTVDMGASGSLTVTGAGNLTITGAVNGSTPSGLLPGGLLGRYYTINPATTNQLDPADPAWLGNQTPVAVVQTPLIDFPDVSANSFRDSTGLQVVNIGNANVEALWTGKINITTAGLYTFFTNSDDGSVLFIDGTKIVDNNFMQGNTERSGTVTLGVGLHDITVAFMQGGGGANVSAHYTPPGGSYQVIPTSVLSMSVNNLTKTGAGTLTLSGSGNYGGRTTVSAGTLVAAGNNALGGTGQGTVVQSGATLGFGGNVNYSALEPVTVTGTGVGGNGAVLNVSGANSFSGPITLTGATTVGSAAGTLTLAGTVTLGANNLTVTGAGDVTVTGTLVATAAPGLIEGRILNNAFDETTPNPGGLTQLGVTMGQIQTVNNGQPQSAHVWSDNTTWVYTGQFFDADGQFAFAENIDDNVLIKIDGVQVLRDTNWSNPTTTGTTTTNFGMGPAGDGWHNIEIRMGNGGGGAGPSGQAGWPGTFGFGLRNATTNLTSVNSADYVIPVDPGDGSLFRAGSPGQLIKSGSGTLTLASANTGFGGAVQVTAGSLIVAANNALGTVGSGTTVGPGGTLGFSSVVYTTAEPVTLSGGTIAAATGNSTFGGPVALTTNSTLTAPAGTSLTFGGPMTAAFGFTKTGAGTVVLAANNPGYTAGGQVSAGTLLVNANTPSGFTAISPGVIGDTGNGGIMGSLSLVNGGTVAPGGVGAAGLFTTGTVSLAGTPPTFAFDLGGTTAGTGGYDQLNVLGGVAVGGANLSLTVLPGFTPAWNTVFRLVDNDGTDAISGTFASVNGVATPLGEGAVFTAGGFSYKISYVGGTGNDLTLTVVDTVAPTSTITTPSGTTPFRTATWPGSISGTATDGPAGGSGVSTVTVTVLKGAATVFTATPTLTAGTWTVSFPASSFTGDGTYTVQVRSTDAAANAETTTTSLNTITVVIDNTPPAAPAVTGISPDTGSSGTDAVTKATNLFLLGTAEPGSTVAVTRVGVGVIGTPTANALGNWTLDYTGTTLAGGTTYNFTATATDAAGNTGPVSATKGVTVDTTTPTVLSVNRVGGANTGAASVQFTVTYSEPVTGVDSTDFVTVNGGSTTGTSVTGVSGSGTTYTVTVNTGSGDGSVGLNALNNGSVQDVAGNAQSGATFTGQVFTVDKSPPTVNSITRLNPAGANTNVTSVQFQVVFSEAVTGVDAADFALTQGAGLSGATVTNVSPAAGPATTYTVTVGSYTGNGTLRLDVTDNDSIIDGSSNPLGGPGTGTGNFTTGQSYTIDSAPPAVVSIVRANPDPTNAASVQYTVTFSEGVTGVDAADFALTATGGVTGASVGAVSGGGATWTVAVNTGSGDGTVRLDLTDNDSIIDSAGNPLGGTGTTGAANGSFTAGQSYTVDKTPPVVTSVSLAGPSPTNAASVQFQVVFGEAVTGVDASDFALTTSGIAGAVVTGVSGGGTTYTVTVGTGFGTGTIRLDVTDDDTIRDLATNRLGGTGTGNGTFTAGQTYSVDTVPPVVQSIVRAGSDPTNAASVTYTVTFSEGVTGVDSGDFTLTTTGGVTGASVGAVSGGGAVWTVTVNTGSGDGTIRLDVTDNDSITDGVTNKLGGTGTGNGTFTTGQVFTVDKTPPVVTSITLAGGSPTNATAVAFTVLFSEPVTGVGAADFALVQSGGLGGAAILDVSGGGTTYTVTVNNYAGAGTLGLDLTDDDSITDAAANPLGGVGPGNGSYTTGQTYSIDRVPPTVTSIVRANPDPTNAASVQYTVTFSEGVTGVDAADFALTATGGVTGASVGAVSGGGATWTVAVNTGSGDGTVRLDLTDNDSITDAVGNPLGGVGTTGAADGSFTTGQVFTVDKTPPVVTSVVRANPDPTNAASVTYTVTFSEPVSGVDVTDFTATTGGSVTGATVTGVSPAAGPATVYTVTVSTGTGSGSGTLRLDVTDNDSITDAATNPLGGTGPGNGTFTTGQFYTVDRLPPAVASISRLSPAGTLTNAGSVQFQVLFSEPVTGVDGSDFAVIQAGGVAGAVVTNVSGSGSTWTVTVSTGVGSGTIRLDVTDDDTIKDLATNPLGGTGPGNGTFSAGQSYTVDTVPPTVTSITRLDGDPTLAASARFQVVFSENVTGVDAADFVLTTTGVSGASISPTVTGGGTTYTVTVNTGTGSAGTVRLDLADNDTIADLAGNKLGGTGTSGAADGSFTAGEFYTVDRVPPSVASITRAGVDPTTASTVRFTVTFDEPVTGVDAGDFATTPNGLVGAGAISGVTGGGAVWTVDVSTGSGTGTVGLSLIDNDTIADLAGNKLGGTGTGNGTFTTGQVYSIDRTPPVVSTLARVEASPTTLSLVHYTVTFSKAVTGVDPSDFALTSSGLTGAAVTAVTGSGTTYTVFVSTGTGNGTLRIDVLDDDTIADAAGNRLGGTGAGNGAFGPGPTFTVDLTAPFVESVTPLGADPTNAGTVGYTVVFSERVTGVDPADFATTGTAAGAGVSAVSGSGTTWTVTVVTGGGDGTVGLRTLNDGTVTDLAGNPLTGPSVAGAEVTVDRTAPAAAAITRVGPSPTNAGAVTFTVVFTEPVSGVDKTDFAAAAGGVAGAAVTAVSGSGTTYTVTVATGTGSGTVGLNLLADGTITDAAANPLAGPLTGPSYTLDRTAPFVASTGLADANPTANGLVRFTVAFAEAVSGVNAGDFALTTTGGLTGARVVGVDGAGANYVVTVDTGPGKGTVRLDVVTDGSVADAVGNPLSGGFTTGPAYTVSPASTGGGGGGGGTTAARIPAVVAGAQGGSSFVTVYDAAGGVLSAFFAYDPSFAGGVHVALGDVNGDGVPDVLMGAGSGGGPHVKVADGTKLNLLLPNGMISDAALLYTFQAYPESFRGGVYVAAGDLDGDGRADVVTGAGDTGGPAITVFSGKDGRLMFTMMAFEDSFRGGVTVAVGDVTGDGRPDIIAGTGPGGGPAVGVFDGPTRTLVGKFFAYDENFRGGVNVAAGDVDGDGIDEIITGAGMDGGPVVGVFHGPIAAARTMSGPEVVVGTPVVPGTAVTAGTPVVVFTAAGRAGGQVNGLRVAAADLTGDGLAEIIVAGGPGSNPATARAYDAATQQELDVYFAADPTFLGGVYVGGE